MKILIIFGTRPEAIKMAPLVDVLEKENCFQVKLCVTAQHRQMLDQVLALFNLKPDFDLNLMQNSQDLTDINTSVLLQLRPILQALRPDLVLVHGDTTTTMAASLAAFYQQIKVGHVEAGLRSGNLYQPWPEEMNRKVVDIISNLYFAPTINAKNHLISEGVNPNTIHMTGNTVIDALLKISKRIDEDELMKKSLEDNFHFIDPQKRMILVTGHRRENFGKGFENLCLALKELARRPDVQIVYPVHLNPNVLEPVQSNLSKETNVHLISPQDYLQFVYLMKKSYLILTDSGGVQEEAPSLGKPVLVMRNVTERQEAVEANTAKLVGMNSKKIIEETGKLLDNSNLYQEIALANNPYGDGHACERIKNALLEFKDENE